MILQASHVGYDAETGTFGIYRRLQSATHECTASCGKIYGVLDWYPGEYRFAQEHILVARDDLGPVVIIDNLLAHQDRDAGLMLHMARLVRFDGEGHPSYVLLAQYRQGLPHGRCPGDAAGGAHSGGAGAHRAGADPDLFYFRRKIESDEEGAVTWSAT